jgi:membrane protein
LGNAPVAFETAYSLIKDTLRSWNDNYTSSMGAALAYYTLFSIAPLLLIVVSVAGSIFGPEAARGEIVGQLRGLMGNDGAHAVEGLLASAGRPGVNAFATLFSAALLLLGATTVFAELQDALDRIWRAPARDASSGVWRLIQTRLLSFGMVLGIAFLLMVSLVFSAAIAALGKWWGPDFGARETMLLVINDLVSFVMFTVSFALTYKIMPRATIAWRDVWIGATVTAMLFDIGKLLIGLYIGKSAIASGFGAAASLVAMLVWVYCSAQIFLFGATFTWVYSHRLGSRHGKRSRHITSITATAVPTT